MPEVESASPCTTTLVATGPSPLLVNTSESNVSRAMPLAASDAPPVKELSSQPRPGLAGGLEQGQAPTPPTPGSHTDTPGTPHPGGLPHFAIQRSPSKLGPQLPPMKSAGPLPSSCMASAVAGRRTLPRVDQLPPS